MWHIDTELICFMFMLVIIIDIYKSNISITLKDKLFNALSFTTIFAIVIDIISSFMMNNPQAFPTWLIEISLLGYFILTPMLAMIWHLYALSVVYNSPKIKYKHLLPTLIPFAIYILFVLSNPYTHCMFSFSATNAYTRGPLFNIIFLVFYGYSIATLILACTNFAKKERMTSVVLVLFPIITGIGVLIQQILTGYLLTGAVFTLVLLITYMFLQNRKATRDNLTGLFNRMAFSNAVSRVSLNNEHGSVLALAIDDFKLFNQAFSQETGDMLLRKIADYLIYISPSKTAYRYGGDIFTIILKKSNEKEVTMIVNTIMTKFSKLFYIENIGYSVSVSLGIVDYPHMTWDKGHSILTSLDFAIYQAKKRGKGQVAFFDEALIDELQRRYEIMSAITRALEEKSFEVFIQPIYNLKARKFMGGEALLRLNDKKLGWIPPSELIPLAEQTGQIVPLTYYVLDKVCAFLKNNQDILHEDMAISVNLSVIHFMQPDMAEKIEAIISSYGISPSLIKIEITEGMIAHSFDYIQKAMVRLNEFGIQFALDDYGQGYSNILYLISLPFTYVKLDKTIVNHMITDKKFISALIPMLKSLDKQLIAEGVETKEQATILDELSCDAIQGFYFSKPLPMEEAVKRFKSTPPNDYLA